jgi:dTDP-L-rhamnose 4-epimerase
MMRVLVTGGAGFIGTHLVRRLLVERCEVTVLDSFHPQIHQSRELPADIAPHVRLVMGDVDDAEVIAGTLQGQDAIVHLAAETGTGQSMYSVARYERTNGLGTAVLLDQLVNDRSRTVRKIVVASSRAIYGEGKYHCNSHGVVFPGARSADAMRRQIFDPQCPVCAEPCRVLPTDEVSPANPLSFYGLTKYMQERSTLMFAEAMGLSGAALRYQNVYGPGQSLKNPYTGILAIFSNLARAGERINVFEDGLESRDFVYVDDVVEATWRCVEPAYQGVNVINVGSGQATSVMHVARAIVEYFSSRSSVEVSGAFRVGDIRHNIADVSRAQALLGFKAKWSFQDGIRAFLDWAANEKSTATSSYVQSLSELKERGLFRE